MMQQALRSIPPDIDHTPAILAADVGGTHARVGWMDIHPGATSPAALADYRVYDCAKWPGLAGILEDFLAGHPHDRHRVTRCSLAVAGYLRDNVLVAKNLRWPVRLSHLRKRLGIDDLDIVNDFEALAHATGFITRSNSTTVVDAAGATGPIAVIGPGTGMGTAVLWPDERGSRVIASEAGQAALAPGTTREIAVLQRLSHDRGYVSAEHVLSGPGLLNLYYALADIDGRQPVYTDPKQVTAAGLDNEMLARDTLATFCALLGSFASDLAVTFRASGGVVLAGGILPSIRDSCWPATSASASSTRASCADSSPTCPCGWSSRSSWGSIGAASMAARALVDPR